MAFVKHIIKVKCAGCGDEKWHVIEDEEEAFQVGDNMNGNIHLTCCIKRRVIADLTITEIQGK